MQNAGSARALGNEGKARVCARRAAGVIIQEYYYLQQKSVHNQSAYELLKSVQDFPGFPLAARHSVELLLLKVNADFDLPEGVDLIAEVENLAKILLPAD